MKHKTILIEDELPALQRLQRLLHPYAEWIEIVDTATTGEEAVQKINAQHPDLLFLDIQLPELSGFQILERLSYLPWVIFSTAYDEYALKAFETHAIDYLLKPIDPARLQKAIDKLQHLSTGGLAEFQQHLQRMLTTLQRPAMRRISVRIGDRIRLLEVKDIYFFRAVDKYVEVHTFEESYLINQSLSQLELQLPAEDFVRIHRAALINLQHLGEIVRWFGGSYRVKMRDKKKTELPVSRHARSKLGFF